MIYVLAHDDHVFGAHCRRMYIRDKIIAGTLDNLLGITFAVSATMLSDPTAYTPPVQFVFSQSEETEMHDVQKLCKNVLDKEDLVIVVDVCNANGRKLDFTLENITDDLIKPINEFQRYCSGSVIDNEWREEQEDEMFVVKKSGLTGLSFCLPVSGSYDPEVHDFNAVYKGDWQNAQFHFKRLIKYLHELKEQPAAAYRALQEEPKAENQSKP